MEDIRTIKQRFEIIGNDIKLNRAIEKAVQVAPTDFTVLITGESGVGKEIFPRIIHNIHKPLFHRILPRVEMCAEFV